MFGLNPETMISGLMKNPAVNAWFEKQFKPMAESIAAHIQTVARMEAKLDALLAQQSMIIAHLRATTPKGQEHDRLRITSETRPDCAGPHTDAGRADAGGDSRDAGTQA
jgi:hypothetical protein